MKRNKFIQQLIDAAQENIWKNEMAIAYKEQTTETSDINITATKDIIKRDIAYIEFLKTQLDEGKTKKAPTVVDSETDL